MVIPEPREHLRQMIADVFAEFMHQEGARDRSGDFAEKLLDDLFPNAEARPWRVPAHGVGYEPTEFPVTHWIYALRTEPVPVEETP